jgi:hypothetical protein
MIFLGLNESTDSVENSTQDSKKTQKKKDNGDGISSMIQNIKNLDKKLLNVKNAFADVYSFDLLGETTVFVVFKSNNTKANMQAFMEIVAETAEELVKKYKSYMYYAFDCDNEMVLAYLGAQSDETFNVEGIYFYVNGQPSDINVNCPYREAYANVVKAKRSVETLTEWDYYMFRNKLPFDEEGDGLISGPIVIGTSAIMEVAKTDWSLVLRDKKTFEEFISIFEKREGIQKYILEHSAGIIWFDESGQRIMAEVISKKTGKLEIDRQWYNGYKMPE